MRYMQTKMNVRLRKDAGLAGDTLGEIPQGAICYVVGESVIRNDLTWINIVAHTTGGLWYDGWAALAYQGDELLSDFAPRIRLDSPVRSRFHLSQLFAENPQTYARFNMVGHNGLDFATPIGTPIYACSPGTIAHARQDPGYGNYIRVDHAWGISLYAHLSEFLLKEGQVVYPHAPMAMSGNSGGSSGPHLHFEIRMYPINEANGYGGRVDPLAYIDRQYLSYLDYVPESLRRGL